ncbi:protein cornichon homolog 1-like [Symsagittifera roscoffensis]|uniref:protein cornichon homolog 1-like n=1 Tax=Symsagittifera roscoffensis TaxID=84072 RepID=UPI00307BD6A0
MAFTFAALAYLLALILACVLLFFAIYQIIAVDELKTDYKNPIEQCNSLNPLVLPEYGILIFYNLLFLLAGDVVTFALNLPMIAYNIYRYANRPMIGGYGIYDPTTIMNTSQLSLIMKEGWIKMAFFLVSFFFYLYCLIYTLITA